MPVSKTKTYTNVYVFCFIFQKLILRAYKCLAKKNLQIVDKTISATLLLFVRVEYARQGKRRGNMIKIERG